MLSTRIWRIEIKGNSSLGEDAILEYLSAHNVTYGMPAKEIDNDALELSLRQDLEPVIWASVYETGTRLVVQIQEKISSHEETKEAEGTCMDLAASADATIASVITRSGLAKVKKGDKVKKAMCWSVDGRKFWMITVKCGNTIIKAPMPMYMDIRCIPMRTGFLPK